MGTSYSVQWADTSTSISTSELKDIIELRLDRINSLMSTYIPNSQLSGFNQSRETGWHAVDEELAQLVELSLSISRLTDGAFDVTVGPLVNLWGFGPSNTNFTFPTDTEIKIAKRSIGYQHLDVRIDPPALNKKIIDLYVDLSAIAKGYAVDEIAKILNQHNIINYMVEIGGEVKGSGIAPHGNPWRIGIETPDFQRGDIEQIISLNNVGVATSGDYRNFIIHNGKHYSHAIDPRSGYPVRHNLGSATVLHKSTAIADAWATAFMVVGAEKSYSLSKQHNLSGVLITRENSKYTSTVFGEMQSYLTK
ncbi:MAG: FAD:protein FMN transferase [Gammaproteobacteria bacterium]|nr:FAD:protein FMN transferase [Gammaproteobacteria bacterium]